MSQRGPWQDGRPAWDRLNGWHRSSTSYGPRQVMAEAERALGDVQLLRRLLDLAEMNAVRAARQAGASWTDVAAMLGVSRQSAWARWRETDEPVQRVG